MRFIFLLPVGLVLLCSDVCGQFPPLKLEPQEIERLAKSEIPTIPYCELLRNPKLFDQKLIRIRGIYALTGGEYSNLYDPSCLNSPTPEEKVRFETETWVWFDEAYETQTNPGIAKIFAQLRDFYGWADVIVVAKFFGSEKHGRYGHLSSARFMLDVVRIEHVQPVNPG